MKILTHNVYWFQGCPSRWGEERVAAAPEALDALTRLYTDLDADVLCLQEVHQETLVRALAHDLRMASWIHAPGGRRPEYGGAVMCRSAAQLRDCTGAGQGFRHERTHLRARLESEGEWIEIAMVHLPSNRYAGSTEAGEAARKAELERALAEPPRPDIVVGDMNCQPGSLPYRFLLGGGYVDAAVVAGGADAQRRRVDYIWLGEALAGRLDKFAVLDSGAFCRTPPQGEPWRLSDHPPLLMELR